MAIHSQSRKRSRKIFLAVVGGALVLAALGLAAFRVISGKPLGIRYFVEVQAWRATSLVKAVAHSGEVKSRSTGDYTNVIFLHHSVGDNLIRQTDFRERLTSAGLSVWDHDYNYYGLRDAAGNSSGYNYLIPDDNTDPVGLEKLFSQKVYGLPVNAISGLMQHEVIIFKSCFTGNVLSDDPQVEEVKGYYETVRSFIAAHPDKLFILLTTPPLNSSEADAAMGARARSVADWLTSAEFKGDLSNLAVFDLYDLLADGDPASPQFNRLRNDYLEGSDNHPTAQANQAIAPLLSAFILQSIKDFRDRQKGSAG